jgi:hypothetical protein
VPSVFSEPPVVKEVSEDPVPSSEVAVEEVESVVPGVALEEAVVVLVAKPREEPPLYHRSPFRFLSPLRLVRCFYPSPLFLLRLSSWHLFRSSKKKKLFPCRIRLAHRHRQHHHLAVDGICAIARCTKEATGICR